MARVLPMPPMPTVSSAPPVSSAPLPPATAPVWSAAPVPEAAAALVSAGISPRLAALLARRGVSDPEGARRFLHPAADQLFDPSLLAGMDEAVARLSAAAERGEEVAVVGDYDVDGVTSTALLLAAFAACGIKARPILPHRLEEGYGFQPVHVERARAAGCKLIVTADCGSSSLAAAEAALACGIDVLVTDHHIPGCELPPAVLQINPRQGHCSYPFPDLAAVGLALKLSLALLTARGKRIDLDALLRIACLGTIADLVPLRGENRVIAALGLAALPRTRSEGLKALMKQAGMKPPYSAADVGFRVGPRINAAGRLSTPEQALELLLTRDSRRAALLALELDTWNRQRQAEELRVAEEATAMAAALRPLPPLLVLYKEGWHKGVVGIAAGRLARDFNRPALLLAVEGDVATGSGRSIPGIELHGFLSPWGERLERFGGHSQAIGLSARLAHLPALQAEWAAAAAGWPAELLARRYEYEIDVEPKEISHELLRELFCLEPHGQGNSRPLVRTGPLTLAAPPRLFGNGHLAARARGAGEGNGSPVELVGWGWQARATKLGGTFEVLGYLEKDDYTGGPMLRLVDSRPYVPSPVPHRMSPDAD
jgi:single-stranded-DNA-specific exonuclease